MSHHHDAADREEQERVVEPETRGRDPRLPPLALVVRAHGARVEEAPRAADAGEHDDGKPVRVIADVLQGVAAVRRVRGRLVAAHLGEAVALPRAGRVAEVDGVAVRAEHRRAVVRREERRALEATEVEHDPRTDDERDRPEHDHDVLDALGARDRTRQEHGRQREERSEQEQLGAGECGDAAHRAQRERGARRWDVG